MTSAASSSTDTALAFFSSSLQTCGKERPPRAYVASSLDQSISRAYAHADVGSLPCRAIVTCREADGFGDVVFALKTCRVITEYFPACKVSLVALREGPLYAHYCSSAAEASPVIWKICQLGGPPKGVELIEAVTVKLPSADSGPCFVLDVATPDRDLHGYIVPPDRSSTASMRHVTVLHLDEYNGWRAAESVTRPCVPGRVACAWESAGLGKSDNRQRPALGIHVDSQLVASAKRSPRERMAALLDLESKELQNSLGVHTRQELDLFASKSKLYFAYVSSGEIRAMDFFVACIAQMLASDERAEMDLVIVGNLSFKSANILAQYCYSASSCATQWRVEIKRPGSRTLVGCYDPPAHEGRKKMRTHMFQQLPNADILRLIQASEPVTHVSGDQSLAEVISAQEKLLFYQMQSWKERLFDAYTAHAHVQGFTRYSRFLLATKSAELCFETIDALTRLMEDPALYTEARDFHRYLCENHNINDWLIGEIKRRLLHNKFQNDAAEEAASIQQVRVVRGKAAIQNGAEEAIQKVRGRIRTREGDVRKELLGYNFRPRKKQK